MKPTLKINVKRELKDFILINFGIISYALGWSAFLLPYNITTGGLTGIAAIIYYATGIPIQLSFFVINIIFLAFSFKILGAKFCIKTLYATFSIAFFLWFFQSLTRGADGNFIQIIGAGQDSMACVIGAVLCGFGLGTVFVNNGSTGGTDIIASVVTKYKNITIGRTLIYCDILIISSCYFVFQDWRRVVFGFVTLTIMSYVVDLIINSSRQSVQFFIISKEYDRIAEGVTKEIHRGVTVMDATGWYSKQSIKTMIIVARKNQSVFLFRMIKDIDPNAFITQSNVTGAYGEGFDKIK
ncbi:MAG: YitT family protein [Bacteroidaceae bacterium]|nr:YitT family protein [Bacteroidaceae bacterium]